MPIKDILVLLDTGETESAAAGLAADLAESFEAHLTGLALAIEPVMPPLLVSPVPVDLIAEAQAESEARAKRAAARFEALMAQRGDSADSVYAAVIAGATGETVARTCRLRDLIVAAGESGDNPEPGRAQVIEAVLFDASRPTLLVPPGYAGGAEFDTILVAWNGSLPASRAVRAGLPFFKRAAVIDVVTVDRPAAAGEAPGEDVLTYLSRHGITATAREINAEAGGIGATLMAEAKRIGADLIVMGGYGHSRLREFILGGATQDLLKAMPVPVLMAH